MKLYISFITVTVVVILSFTKTIHAQDFYIHENGVTIVCDAAEVGDTWDYLGVTYTKRQNSWSGSSNFLNKLNFETSCTSGITNMEGQIHGTDFSGDISHWDVSSVTNMKQLFYTETSFNGDISNWDVSNVVDMSQMFDRSIFNGDISAWNTESVSNMWRMFMFSEFDGDISSWNTNSVTDMMQMFNGAKFSGDISNWDVSNVTDMSGMFYENLFFNSPLNDWDVSSVIDFSAMFGGSVFNQEISQWDVSSVQMMDRMFSSAAFDKDISSWCVTNISNEPSLIFENNSIPEAHKPIWGTCPEIQGTDEIPLYIPTDGLVAWYPFNGNANDESGNGNNGTVNGATLTTDKDGNENSAYSFDGVDDKISIANSDGFNDLTELTISVWVNFSSLPNWKNSDGGRSIITKLIPAEANINLSFALYTEHDEDALRFDFNTSESSSNNRITPFSNYLTENTWYNLIFTYDGEYGRTLWDGEIVSESSSINGQIRNTLSELNIGGSFRSKNKSFDGQIDDVAIWNRALSNDEIIALHNETNQQLSDLTSKTLSLDISYSKEGYKVSNYLSLDALSASDSLVSYQFDMILPEGIVFDSLKILHTESSPSYQTNLEDNTLSVVVTGSGFITTHDPLMELFFTPNTTGSFFLEATNIKLNSTPITNTQKGLMIIDPFVAGDVDDSGEIDGYDASIILHRIIGSNLLPSDPVKNWEEGPWFNWRNATADVDGDGELLALDASLISQYVVGLINDFSNTFEEVAPVVVEVTQNGLRITAPENIQSLSLDIPETNSVEFKDPEIDWDKSLLAYNNENGFKIAIASSEQIFGNFLNIPLNVYSSEDVTIEFTSVTNNIQSTHQVTVNSFTVNNEKFDDMPNEYILGQNYPNPFNPSTQIQYSLPENTFVTLEVFNSVGQQVAQLVNAQKSAGNHVVNFDATGLSSGVLLYRLTTPSFIQTKKMLLIK
jgi:hypothetical protein